MDPAASPSGISSSSSASSSSATRATSRQHIYGAEKHSDESGETGNIKNRKIKSSSNGYVASYWSRYWKHYIAGGTVLVALIVLIVLLILKPWNKYPMAPLHNDAVKALPDEQPIWPIPNSFSYGVDSVLIDPDFHITVQSTATGAPLAAGSYPILEKAIARCMDRLQLKRNTTISLWAPDLESNSHTVPSGPTLSELVILVENAQATLEYGMIESYSLDVTTKQKIVGANTFKEYDQGLDKRGPGVGEDQVEQERVQQDGSVVGHAVLKATTQWGVIHGLETFSQLVRATPESAESTGAIAAPSLTQKTDNPLDIPNTPWSIQDEPRYSHRGILLDTSRNYFPVKDIIRTLEAMSVVKMNVFHWHVLDQQSYPLVSKTFPELSAKGAERPDLVYTHEDVAAIIQYGEERGIRVLPEFDAPGHTASWGRAFPNITVCVDKQPHAQYAAEPPAGQLDPLEPFTYTVLDGLVKEWAAQFPDSQVHMGGDEVSLNCWRSSERLKDYIRHPSHRKDYEKALPPTVTPLSSSQASSPSKSDLLMRRTGSGSQSGEDRLLEVYLDRAVAMFLEQDKRPIVWEELALEHNVKLPDSAIVQVWKSASNAKRVIKQGRPVILSSAEFWYLDCGHGSWLIGSQGQSWCGYSSWQRVYSYRLTDQLNAEQQKMVYGGEVCMWSEQTSSSNLDSSLWPRAAAAAEVLWSGTQDDQGQNRPLLHAAKRLAVVRDRLVQMGIAAAPLFPSWCGKHPEACLA
ncbi:hypothetical protein BGZ99_003526 [Dissophora globulifera]|uniref:beta-N-acetylhexosaminidase n=1 Tax=Dissophora globulifera TaxID=979702 RepID=A0A9P6RL28_9FUNG|nr:hypothetical protein BGZ99_003526 [Dissophora globulifera]